MGNCFVPKKRFNNPYLANAVYLTPVRGSVGFNTKNQNLTRRHLNYGGLDYNEYGGYLISILIEIMF